MKRKGFTLIELLAVIVILAIIALISTPIIINVIEKARKGAFEDSAYGVVDAAKLYFTDKLADTNSFSRTEFDFSNDMKDLKLGGEKPAGGSLIINDDGDQALAIYDKDKKWCAVKTFTEEKIRILENYKKCDKDVAENLFVNGYGEYGNNTHFENLTFNNGEFSFPLSGSGGYAYGNYIEIDPSKKYKETVEVKFKDVNPNNNILLGLVSYDADKNIIVSDQVYYVDGTTTYLTQDLKNGDNVVYLNDVSHFVEPDTKYRGGFIFWNYKDSMGHLYPVGTYSRNRYIDLFDNSGIDRSNHTITLKQPWNNGLIPKGTYLNQSNETSNHNYGLSINGTPVTNTFTYYENVIEGVIKNNGAVYTKFREGTKYVRFLFFTSSAQEEDSKKGTFTFKNLTFKEV